MKTATVESARLGSKLAQGAQHIVESAEHKIQPSYKPKNVQRPQNLVQGIQMGIESLGTGFGDAKKTYTQNVFEY
jgi:hypothetical protein